MLFVVANVGKSLYVDWLWFDSVAYLEVFRTVLIWKVSLFFAGAVLSVVVIGANIWLARRLAPVGPEESFIEEVDAHAIRRIVTIALIAATVFMAVIFGSVSGGAWEIILSWRNAVPFGGEPDPVFNRDISFYLFDLPAFHFFQVYALWLLIVSAAGAAAVYGLSLSLQGFELNINRGMRVHLSMLAGLILLVITAGTFIGRFDLVADPRGLIAGATYADINARLPVRYILIVLGAFAGIAAIANAFLSSSSYRLPIFAVGLWAIAGLAGGAIYPAVVQRTVVDPNQLERERPFIERNIRFTQLAYGLDEIDARDFAAEPEVSIAEIEANPDTIRNIRLLDARPSRDTFNQMQSIRPLYFFNGVDIDRYEIDGVVTQVMLSARELDIRRAADRNWTNDRLKRTHGYGAVIAPVNRVVEEGLPDFITRDIPPVGEEIPISESGARIYFGELTTHYVIVNTNEPEFDYPVGTLFKETFYEGDAGIRLSNVFKRFVLAWDLGDTNLLISGQIGSGSQLLMNRSLNVRISEVAPFLSLDADPYLVVDNGQLLWIQDAYTTSSAFPYSQPSAWPGGSINYIRNSVKITVDARTGDMTFYLIDEQDPIVQTWASIFPDLFTPIDRMPAELRAHLRYPQDLFQIQSNVYLRYHINDANTFFLNEDLWNIPTERLRQQEVQVEPYYVIMTLPGEAEAEFVLILPFTPRNKQNTVAWMAGRSDGEHLGKLRAYRFPTDDLVFGPAQIEARIDQDPAISQQLTLWDQGGSEVFRGNLLMIPIGESFIFVEPIYLQAETGRLPELKRVIVANGNKIAMEKTFQAALDVVLGIRASSLTGADILLGTGTRAPAPTPTPTPQPAAAAPAGSIGDLITQAEAAADAVGDELDRLRTLLEAIRQQQQSE